MTSLNQLFPTLSTFDHINTTDMQEQIKNFWYGRTLLYGGKINTTGLCKNVSPAQPW
jgi:hypothetical protein